MELVSNNTGLVFFFRRNIDMLVLVAAYFQTACRVENFFFPDHQNCSHSNLIFILKGKKVEFF